MVALGVVGFIIVVAVAAALVVPLQVSYVPPSSPSSGTTTTAVPTGTVVVIMPQGVGANTKLNYEPANITVVIGVNNTILWKNEDNTAEYHTVTSRTVPAGAASFNSGNLVDGATFQITLTVPGVYTYYCIYHFWMVGQITVLPASSTTTSS
ncbi:MAG: cupredoxin domain-containing protein [Thermoprotei archaeon]